MNQEKIAYVELPAADFSATKAFYNKAFAWQFIDYGEEYIAIKNAGLDGGFYKSDKSSSTKNGAALIVLYSENLELSLEKVEQAGGKIVETIFSFPGGRRFHFSDPNGNELAIWSDK